MPLFLMQLIILLFIWFITPGLVDDENGESKLAYLLFAYYLTLWLTELAYLLYPVWLVVVMFPCLMILITIIVICPGFCKR
jgi:hypothetical protein